MRDEGLCRVGWSTARASLDLGTDINVRTALLSLVWVLELPAL
jgi:hypothetical protein